MTIDGWLLFQLHDREGFPLVCSLIECERRGLKVDWIGWYRAAKSAGWEFKTTRRVVEEAIADSGWKETFMDTTRQVFNEVTRCFLLGCATK